jgi:hypothetical protein
MVLTDLCSKQLILVLELDSPKVVYVCRLQRKCCLRCWLLIFIIWFEKKKYDDGTCKYCFLARIKTLDLSSLLLELCVPLVLFLEASLQRRNTLGWVFIGRFLVSLCYGSFHQITVDILCHFFFAF